MTMMIEQIKIFSKSLNDFNTSSSRVLNQANETISLLQKELEVERVSKGKEQSDSFTTGLLTYLVNFIAADSEYDWESPLVPPLLHTW